MDFTYRELSNKVGEKWDVVKDENPISKDKCIELQTVIMRFLPVISSCIGDIGELDFGDLKKAQFAISHQADIITQCEQGFSYKDRIDTLQKSISSCYGRCRPNPNSIAELEALRNKETELEDFQKLCKTQSFKLLSKVARNLNISDGTELYCALQMVVYYVEIQCYISDIDRNTELERMFNTKDKGDTPAIEQRKCATKKISHNDTTSKEKHENNTPPQRNIDVDSLRGCFTLAFKGGGNGNMDYFTDNLLPDLKANRSDKEFAKIAFMIYESGKLISSMRPNTFKKWYKKFCELVGCGFHEDYKPSILKADDNFKRTFYYLQR